MLCLIFEFQTTAFGLNGFQDDVEVTVCDFKKLRQKECASTPSSLKELIVMTENLDSLNGNEFLDYHSLEVLYIKFNQISEIPSTQFKNLHRLQKLYLHENDIKKINKKLFASNINLESLSLSANEISTLHFKTFSTLSKLQEIDLSSNQLTSLDTKLFCGNSNLKKLDLSYNKLEQIDPSFFEPLVALVKVDFDGNICIGWSIQSSIQSYNETIVNNCTVTEEVQIEWLNDLVLELKEEGERKCSESEIESVNTFLNQTGMTSSSDAFVIDIERLQIEINELKEQIETLQKENKELKNKYEKI